MADDPRNERVGGSRHYTGQGLGTIVSWKCPRCAAENSGDIQQGCSSCGAGKPGEFKGVPPPIPTDAEGRKLWVEETPALLRLHNTGDQGLAFSTFLKALDFEPDTQLKHFLHLAFDAGVQWATSGLNNPQSEPIVEPADLVSLPRELVQKVIEILESIETDDNTEELITVISQLREAME